MINLDNERLLDENGKKNSEYKAVYYLKHYSLKKQFFKMKYISVLIIILMLSIIYVLYKVVISNRLFTLNKKMKKEISSLLTECKLHDEDYKKLSSFNNYIKYMNNISCQCKGIGYWGGFCLKKENIYVGGNDYHDVDLANKLAELFENKTVVDLGSGLGWYCPIISKKSKKCDEFDGSVNIEEATNRKVKYLNLAEPIQFECNYDAVISLEVAEHIPKQYEETYVNNLIKCSKEALLITWSRIGQGGHFHVNNKNKEDVITLFESKGLKYINDTTNRIKNCTGKDYLRENMLYFKK